MTESILPPVTQEPLLHVDLTPNSGLPLRILRAYAYNCDCMWESNEPCPLLDAMNEHNRQRKTILEAAIRKLQRGEEEA
jgi:hypothetical protein